MVFRCLMASHVASCFRCLLASRCRHRCLAFIDALYKARYLISLHNGMTVRCDGEEWALDFGQELNMIDAALKTVGVDKRAAEFIPASPTPEKPAEKLQKEKLSSSDGIVNPDWIHHGRLAGPNGSATLGRC
ncbi:protein of unknown function [Paraburkholderia kururiensis]